MLDRFTMRIAIGYPPLAEEARMLSENAAETPLDTLECVASAQEVLGAIEAAKGVFVEESLNRYVVAVLRHTRSDARLFLGASPRAGSPSFGSPRLAPWLPAATSWSPTTSSRSRRRCSPTG